MYRCQPDRLRWLLLALPALAASATAEQVRQHDTHEHGRGELSVAVDGEHLLVEFRMPAVNVTGFEHAARDADERRAVADAITRFEQTERLLQPSQAADCTAEGATVTLDAEAEHAGEQAHEHEHKVEVEHENEHEHAAEHEDEHDQEHDQAHSELHGVYRWHCASPERLAGLRVDLFDALEGVEAIDAQVVTATLQSASRLTSDQRLLQLTP